IQTNETQSKSGVIDALIDSVRLDTAPLVTGEDAISSLKVIIGMIEAAETNRVIKI
ncbi:Gfo/Idh/MocA family oxidoreductase, partial [Peribacillus acanthi]|uniref:Gfo/Idh/MocA family oxidoreductase n=1 Tax=Peribacillus acanthi TaxID=2171554 RepID=UPI0030B85282